MVFRIGRRKKNRLPEVTKEVIIVRDLTDAAFSRLPTALSRA